MNGKSSPLPVTILLALLLTIWSGCYSVRSSRGGAGAEFDGTRVIVPGDIALPAGYRIEAVATGLTFPTGIAFDGEGVPHVTEAGYSYGNVRTTPRLIRLSHDGSSTVIAEGQDNGPWNGVTYVGGRFYIAEGGTRLGGRILEVSPTGALRAIVSGLPGMGDHHTNGPVAGPDGLLYFGQGTATNSAVVGVDNHEFGRLVDNPRFHDIPCRDITLAGENFSSADPRTEDSGDEVTTGAYSPFGVATEAGQVVPGQVPCSGAVMRIRPDGSGLELIAWGLRNPFGLAFSPDGELFVTDNGYDDRGSRPVWGAGDYLWRIIPGTWYGWPDYAGGEPVYENGYAPPGEAVPPRLLLEHPNAPPSPAATLGVHSSSNGFDISRSEAFGFTGEAFIAQLGDISPSSGKVLTPVGFKVVRADPRTGVITDFAANRGRANGPASLLGTGGLERPVAARFSPEGESLYVVDFGVLAFEDSRLVPYPGTGAVFRITKEGSR